MPNKKKEIKSNTIFVIVENWGADGVPLLDGINDPFIDEALTHAFSTLNTDCLPTIETRGNTFLPAVEVRAAIAFYIRRRLDRKSKDAAEAEKAAEKGVRNYTPPVRPENIEQIKGIFGERFYFDVQNFLTLNTQKYREGPKKFDEVVLISLYLRKSLDAAKLAPAFPTVAFGGVEIYPRPPCTVYGKRITLPFNLITTSVPIYIERTLDSCALPELSKMPIAVLRPIVEKKTAISDAIAMALAPFPPAPVSTTASSSSSSLASAGCSFSSVPVSFRSKPD